MANRSADSCIGDPGMVLELGQERVRAIRGHLLHLGATTTEHGHDDLDSQNLLAGALAHRRREMVTLSLRLLHCKQLAVGVIWANFFAM